jgi:hypothetical protein
MPYFQHLMLPLMSSTNWHIALDGKTWTALRNYLPELLPQIATRGTIFARMAPDQKTQLVEMLQSLDYIVAMCGDGANDCGVSTESALFTALSPLSHMFSYIRPMLYCSMLLHCVDLAF